MSETSSPVDPHHEQPSEQERRELALLKADAGPARVELTLSDVLALCEVAKG